LLCQTTAGAPEEEFECYIKGLAMLDLRLRKHLGASTFSVDRGSLLRKAVLESKSERPAIRGV